MPRIIEQAPMIAAAVNVGETLSFKPVMLLEILMEVAKEPMGGFGGVGYGMEFLGGYPG